MVEFVDIKCLYSAIKIFKILTINKSNIDTGKIQLFAREDSNTEEVRM